MSIRDADLPDQPLSWLGKNGVVYHDLSGVSHLSVDLMQYLFNQRLKLSKEKVSSVIILAENVLTVDFEVQIHASHPKVLSSTSALAIVGNSFMLRHLTSMFLSYHAPAYPVSLFDSEEEARAWLCECQRDLG